MPPGTKKKALGQYFTTSARLQDFIYEHVGYKGQPLLEPAVGAGHLLQPFLRENPAYPIISYEIDESIARLPLRPLQEWVIADFLTAEITELFPTIIGNPPYVKRKGKPNLYIDFVDRCFDLLTAQGEMLMIVPSDFLKLTSASDLLKRMTAAGAFTDFLFPHDETLFPGAAIDIVVFRYQKGLCQKTHRPAVNGEPKRLLCSDGIITFAAPDTVAGPLQIKISDFFDVYVGLVTGADAVYRHPQGNVQILTDQNTSSPFILPSAWPMESATLTAHLLTNKPLLLNRRIRKFTEANWWQWGALRNVARITAEIGKPCIYVRMMTRQPIVAFAGTVQHFGGGLLCLIPKAESEERIPQVLETIQARRADYVYAGRFKIGQKQVSELPL